MAKNPFRRVIPYYWRQVKKYKWPFFMMFGAYGGATIVTQLVPLYYRDIVDVITHADTPALVADRLMSLMLAIAILTLTYNALYRLGDYCIVKTHGLVTRALADYAFSKIQAHSYRFFSETFAGSLVAKTRRFIQGYDSIQDQFLFSFWMTGIQFVSILVVLFALAPLIAAIFLFWCCIYLVITFVFVKVRTKYDLSEATADSAVTARLSDVLSNVLNIKIFAARFREEDTFGEVTTQQMKARTAAWNFDTIQNTVQGLFMALLQVGGLYFSIQMWLAGTISNGTIVLIETYLAGIFGSIWHLGKSISQVGKSVSYAVEMVDVFEQTPDILDPVKPEKVRIRKGAISFKNIAELGNTPKQPRF
ncbi:MAG: ATP-binding cassette, subfamily B, bacterial [Parcubacteria group bacterium Gr01-1014_48]|nr:MAG: ATP-binding cassette, subfamily B, bacterial [Parcubacteria group bacterium Gr01-1014_48]